jgi:hypothetical protein
MSNNNNINSAVIKRFIIKNWIVLYVIINIMEEH